MVLNFDLHLVRPTEYAEAGALLAASYATVGGAGSPEYAQRMQDILARATISEVYVARRGARLLGCVTFAPPDSELHQGDDPEAATIRMLGVHPDARDRGLGQALVARCIERAQELGLARIRLHTRPDMHAAQRLYERMGFVRDPSADKEFPSGLHLLGYALTLPPGSSRST